MNDLTNNFESKRLIYEYIGSDNISVKKLYNLTSQDCIKNISKYCLAPNIYNNTLEETRDYIKNETNNIMNKNYIIIRKKDKKYIGETTISQKQNTAFLGVWISKKYWNNGYGMERAERIMELLFEENNFNKIEIFVLDENKLGKNYVQKYINKYNGKNLGLKNKSINGEINKLQHFMIKKDKYLKSKILKTPKSK